MALPTFGNVRELPSGRFQARYRPRHLPHLVKTFDEKEQAHAWLNAVEEATANERKLELQAGGGVGGR